MYRVWVSAICRDPPERDPIPLDRGRSVSERPMPCGPHEKNNTHLWKYDMPTSSSAGSTNKHMELWIIQSINECLLICGGLILSLSVCEWWSLLTILKEAMGNIVHLIDQRISDSVWLFMSFSFSVWIHTPVNRVKWRKNGSSSVLHPSCVCPSVCDCVLVCLWMCGCGHPRTQLNPETSGRVRHLTQKGMFVNMWWCCSLHFTVWLQIPVK